MSDKVYTVQDYKSGQPRWCPGCGDHAFLNHCIRLWPNWNSSA